MTHGIDRYFDIRCEFLVSGNANHGIILAFYIVNIKTDLTSQFPSEIRGAAWSEDVDGGIGDARHDPLMNFIVLLFS